ncbi:response regulator transcription factor [Thermosynechococcus sp. B0]|uniref:response regulator transcription factor n=1 Tax=unclassified Thermosynechococcus TaxID=2622553 RepID=UPI002575D08E|nr:MULTISPECIES: response regulator transcription factor [unclassified Thermosynechococcus]WJI24822.1 response regulator transcription factor [Thermosynechococcus sp. B0]WJI27338.1 response regulator transcription factor [Thermosynechococcus sp. B1]WJI29870.1 response regulator transcription factor [Thermosynechococcus sp. B3]
MRILFVEDDPHQRQPIYLALQRQGYTVDTAPDLKTAYWLVHEVDYELLILDWLLPDGEGTQLCRYYRQQQKTAPIVFLTAKDTTADKVTGLDVGADDYLIKPVDLLELLARIRALRRRSPLWQGDELTLEGLTLHLETRKLSYQGAEIQLKSRDFQLLSYLMRHPRQVLSCQQIESQLWEWDKSPESNAVAVRVKRLREQLKQLGVEHWLKTHYGSGYSLNPQQNVS